MFQFTPIAQVLAVTTVVNAVVFVISWRRRHSTGGREFAFGMLAATVWTCASALDYAAVPLELKIFFAKVEYAASYAALTLLAMFAICFAGLEQWLEAPGRRLLLALPATAAVLLAWTNHLHGWIWSGFREGSLGLNTVVFEHGPGYALALIVGYGLIGITASNLWQVSLHGSEVARKQARLILAATLVPILGHLVYLLQDPVLSGVDWSSITFSATGALVLVALYATGFLDLAPIAREQLVRGLSDGLIVLDPTGRVVEINEAALDMLERTQAETVGRELKHIAPGSGELLGSDLAEESRGDWSMESAQRVFDVRISPLFRQRGRFAGRLLVMRDITERRQAEEALRRANEKLEQQLEEIEGLQKSLREQAVRDPLTRLPNRRLFAEVIERELHQAARHARSVCLVSIDLDHFKRINDQHGHAGGDHCLVRFAAMLTASQRPSDFACRYGGEEFLLVLPDTELEGARHFAERLRKRVETTGITVADEAVQLTISAGIAAYPAHGADSAELIEAADRALYRAKHQGRNRVVCWTDEWKSSARVLS